MGFNGPLGRSCYCTLPSPINLQTPVAPSTHSATWGFHFPIFSWDQKGTGFLDDLELLRVFFHGVELKKAFHWGPSLPLRIWNLREPPLALAPGQWPPSSRRVGGGGALFAALPAGRSRKDRAQSSSVWARPSPSSAVKFSCPGLTSRGTEKLSQLSPLFLLSLAC